MLLPQHITKGFAGVESKPRPQFLESPPEGRPLFEPMCRNMPAFGAVGKGGVSNRFRCRSEFRRVRNTNM
eukprot:3317983-Alexandrium_andersonii.AAC.1